MSSKPAIALALAVLVLAPASPAAAQQGCTYDGQPVPHGTRVGSLVCDDGQWVAADRLGSGGGG